MAESAASNCDTVTVTEGATQSPSQQRVVLKLKKPKNNKKVQWDESAVDNEFMGKKTSKCCCIYEKPRRFGDSSDDESDDSDGDCPHNAYCSGHKANKHDTHHHHHHHDSDHSKGSEDSGAVSSNPSNP